MKKYISVLAACLAVATLLPTAQANELIGNGGFESDLLPNDSVPTFGNFTLFLGGVDPANQGLDMTDPVSGTNALTLSISGEDNAFVGFQQLVSVTAGEEYTYSLDLRQVGGVFDIQQAEYRFEWQDSMGMPIFNTDNGDLSGLSQTYQNFSRTEIAPAGAAQANIVFALASFNAGGTNTGTVYIDNVSVTSTKIPEPASASLMALAMGAFVARRRRRR